LPASMSEGLDIRFHAPVANLRRANDRVTGVVLEDGETLAADFVVLATDPFVIDRLAGIGTGRGSVGTTTLWVGSPEPIVEGRKIVLHANQNPFVHHIVPVSNVAPQTAPAGCYLTALCLGDGIAGDNDFLMQRAAIDLSRLLRGDRRAIQVLSTLELVAASRTPHAQLRQPPGFRHQLFSVDPGIPGLRITGELADTASIDGALASGVRAARSLITQSGSVDTDHPGKSVCPTG